MKTLLTVLSLSMIFIASAQCQSEHLIDYDETRSVIYAQMIGFRSLVSPESGPVIYIRSIPFSENQSGVRPYDGAIQGESQQLIHLSEDGITQRVDSFHLRLSSRQYLNPFGNTFFSTSFYEDEERGTENGVNHVMPCKRFVAATADTLTNVTHTWLSTRCAPITYLGGMLYSEPNFYILHSDLENTYMDKLDTQLVQQRPSIVLDEYSLNVKANNLDNGFYAFTSNPTDETDHRVQALSLDGDLTPLTAYFNYEHGKFPRLDYDGQFIYVFPPMTSSPRTEILKYDDEGNLLASYDTGLRIFDWRIIPEGVLVIQQGQGDMPVVVSLLNNDLELITSHSYGYETVTINNVWYSSSLETLVVVGHENRHFMDDGEPRANNRLYYLKETIENLTDTSTTGEGLMIFYPNPTISNIAFVKKPSGMSDEINVTVVSNNGEMKTVNYKTHTEQHIQLELENLGKGVYNFIIWDKLHKKTYRGRFIKN